MSLEEIENRPLRLGVLTVSDTRTPESDKGGDKVVLLAETAGHNIVKRAIVKDEYELIYHTIKEWCECENVDVVISTGGTGIAIRDITIEAVSTLFQKEIPGFGEIFRYLSFTEDIGTKAIASRAVGGVYHSTLILAIPGSVGAVTLGMERLILPEIKHLVREITK